MKIGSIVFLRGFAQRMVVTGKDEMTGMPVLFWLGENGAPYKVQLPIEVLSDRPCDLKQPS